MEIHAQPKTLRLDLTSDDAALVYSALRHIEKFAHPDQRDDLRLLAERVLQALNDDSDAQHARRVQEARTAAERRKGVERPGL